MGCSTSSTTILKPTHRTMNTNIYINSMNSGEGLTCLKTLKTDVLEQKEELGGSKISKRENFKT